MRPLLSIWVCFSLLLSVIAGSGCEINIINEAEDNKQIIRGFVEAMNNRDYEALDSLIAPDLVRHSQATPDVEVRNREDFIEFIKRDAKSFPDGHQEIQMMVAEDDKVATFAVYSGTQEGQMGPFPPTGNQFKLNFIGILRIEDGQIAEIWVEWDNLSMLNQLGHFPPDTNQAE